MEGRFRAVGLNIALILKAYENASCLEVTGARFDQSQKKRALQCRALFNKSALFPL